MATVTLRNLGGSVVMAVAQGVVRCHQSRTLDYKERSGQFLETLPVDVVEEVLARVRTLLA